MSTKATQELLAPLIDVDALASHFAQTFSNTNFVLDEPVFSQTEDVSAGLVSVYPKTMDIIAKRPVKPDAKTSKYAPYSIVPFAQLEWPEGLAGSNTKVTIQTKLPVGGPYDTIFIGVGAEGKPPVLLTQRQLEYVVLHYSSIIKVIQQLKSQLQEVREVFEPQTVPQKRKAMTMGSSFTQDQVPRPVPSRLSLGAQPKSVSLQHAAPTLSVNAARQKYDQEWDLVPETP